ncbi:MAG: Holliday junction resolvase-like protein [Candidatus Odinarchaeota archaeon]
MIEFLLSGLAITIAILILTCFLLIKRNRALQREIEAKITQQKSLSTTYGRISEQWFPLMETYPYDPQNFRFIGSPIDGIQFTDDKIIFCEFYGCRRLLL